MKKNISEISVGGAINITDLKIIYNINLAEENKELLTIGKLTKRLNIAPVNVWKHLKHLTEMGVVSIDDKVGKGKKKFIQIANNQKAKNLVNLSSFLKEAEAHNIKIT